ncbi:hypothetical protein FKM82_020865 [Ascaphus truei]
MICTRTLCCLQGSRTSVLLYVCQVGLSRLSGTLDSFYINYGYLYLFIFLRTAFINPSSPDRGNIEVSLRNPQYALLPAKELTGRVCAVTRKEAITARTKVNESHGPV